MTPRDHSSIARASATPAEPGHGSASVCADGSVVATSVPRQCRARVKDFAPHLAGRMLPGLFSCDLKIGQRERFPGDPWSHFPPSPTWHWMHTTECGSPNHIGSSTSRPIARLPFPADLDALFVSLPAASPTQPKPAALQAALFPETVA